MDPGVWKNRTGSYRRLQLIAALFVLSAVGTKAADAQPYDPPPSAFTAYWEVPAFKDFPYKGPAAAKGILFYSHGVSGTLEQYSSPPEEYIRDFARAGWDVVKIQRNNTHERGWSASGTRHVDDLLERVKRVHAQGYRKIIAAGQSYGGAISIEASTNTDLLFGIIATGPGHGSDACGSRAGFSNSRIADNLQRQLVGAIEKAKAPRIVVVMAANDECQGFNNPTSMIRAALNKAPGRFIFLDDTMPVHGHGAAGRNQFRLWYGNCVLDFLNPDKEPGDKESRCRSPNPVPKFLFPSDFSLPAASPAGEKLLGPWSGALASATTGAAYGQEVCLVVERVQGNTMTGLMSFGAGPERKLSMSWSRRSLQRTGETFVFRQPNSSYQIVLTPGAAGAKSLSITSPNGSTLWETTLARGC